MARKKIALIGAGNIGGELAAQIARRELGNSVLFDIPEKEGMAKGKALDIMQEGGVTGFDCSVIGTSKWEDCKGANVLVITAGVPRKPGQSRDDLIGINLPIIRNVAKMAKEYCPEAGAVIISNPLDVMVYEFKKTTGWTRDRVLGMAGILDTARFSYFVADAAGVSTKDVRTMVLGGHGDQMVPLISCTTVNGIGVDQFLSKEQLDAIVKRTSGGGGEIVKLMGTSAWFAPAAAAIQMLEAIFHDSRRVLPCSVELDKEYGGAYKGLFLGVPCVLGKNGLEKILELPLAPAEKELLDKSAKAVKEVVDVANKM
ncbi:MAG: malate dehydrogenase [Deltaproteobacteria bacterium]|nr:malate dehydrogenase [Deltaproteobacteria bacterium]